LTTRPSKSVSDADKTHKDRINPIDNQPATGAHRDSLGERADGKRREEGAFADDRRCCKESIGGGRVATPPVERKAGAAKNRIEAALDLCPEVVYLTHS
jgi:hypothetical protein